MIRRFIDFGNRYVVGKMEDPNSMLYKLVQTSRDEEEGTKKIKKENGKKVFLKHIKLS